MSKWWFSCSNCLSVFSAGESASLFQEHQLGHSCAAEGCDFPLVYLCPQISVRNRLTLIHALWTEFSFLVLDKHGVGVQVSGFDRLSLNITSSAILIGSAPQIPFSEIAHLSVILSTSTSVLDSQSGIISYDLWGCWGHERTFHISWGYCQLVREDFYRLYHSNWCDNCWCLMCPGRFCSKPWHCSRHELLYVAPHVELGRWPCFSWRRVWGLVGLRKQQ